MIKKLSLLLGIVAAMAFAVPAMASASSVTAPAGSLAPVGTALTGTGSGVVLKHASFGTFKCGTLAFNATLSSNNGSSFAAAGENGTAQECAEGQHPITATSFNVSNLSSSTSGSGVASFSIKEDIASLTCTYTGTAVPFTYTVGGSSITISEGSLSASPPACGGEKISGTFAIAKSGGGAVVLD
jgi:hypothetical protein